MTGRLDFVLQFRDEQVAEEVRQKAALGWFDVEFTVYGTAYLKNERMYYRISSSECDIDAFVEKSLADDIFCGNVICYTQRCSVPIGTKEDKALEVKKHLGKMLQKKYPRALFDLLQEIATEVGSDESYSWLQKMQEALEGVFDEEKLKYFAAQVAYCYSCQRLSKAHCLALNQWIEEEHRYMEDDFIQKDLFEKKFYGIIYENQQAKTGFRYLEDSLAEYIYQKKFAMEEQGLLVGPVYEKHYWYHYGKTIADLRRGYMEVFQKDMDEAYWAQLEAISQKKILGKNYAARIRAMSEDAQATYRRYLGRWGIEEQ